MSDKDKAESQHVHIAEPEEVESDVPVYNRAALIKQYRVMFVLHYRFFLHSISGFLPSR